MTRKLTESEVADYLRVTPRTLRQWRWRRVGPPFTKAGGRVLYDTEALEAWLAKRTVDPDRVEARIAGGEK